MLENNIMFIDLTSNKMSKVKYSIYDIKNLLSNEASNVSNSINKNTIKEITTGFDIEFYFLYKRSLMLIRNNIYEENQLDRKIREDQQIINKNEEHSKFRVKLFMIKDNNFIIKFNEIRSNLSNELNNLDSIIDNEETVLRNNQEQEMQFANFEKDNLDKIVNKHITELNMFQVECKGKFNTIIKNSKLKLQSLVEMQKTSFNYDNKKINQNSIGRVLFSFNKYFGYLRKRKVCFSLSNLSIIEVISSTHEFNNYLAALVNFISINDFNSSINMKPLTRDEFIFDQSTDDNKFKDGHITFDKIYNNKVQLIMSTYCNTKCDINDNERFEIVIINILTSVIKVCNQYSIKHIIIPSYNLIKLVCSSKFFKTITENNAIFDLSKLIGIIINKQIVDKRM